MLHKLLTNNGRFSPDHPDYRRVYLLNVMLLLFLAVSVTFSILNSLDGRYTMTATHAAVAAISCVTLLYFHKSNRLAVCSYIVIATMFVLLATTFFIVGQSVYILVWICTFPPVVLFLIGLKKGLLLIAFFFAFMTVYLLMSLQGWSTSGFSVVSVVNILSVLFVLVLLIGYFEQSRQEAASAVVRKNSELEKANSALEEANNALHASREELRLILDSTAEAIFGVDIETRCTFCNASCLDILGLKEKDDLLGMDIHELIHNRRRDGSPLPRTECNIVRTCMEGVPIHADDEVFWRPVGTSFDVEYYSYPTYKDGEVVGAVVTFTDNTLRKLHEQQTEYFSSHDTLTGLLNRNYFEGALRKTDVRNNLPISVIMGDLNGLKLMNDIFGHEAGDELLAKSAEVLKRICRNEDLIARLGGDEFVILLPKTQREEAELVMERIKESLRKERVNAILCSMSLGCDTKTSLAQSLDQSIKNAENEMYGEKTKSRNQVNVDMINAIIMTLYQKYPEEERHSETVSALCQTIGEALGLPETEIAALRSAGYLHDIGKIGIDIERMDSPASYSADEELEYMQHPMIGYRILNLFDHTLSLAESVYSHHERWDGTGYPRGLKGTAIPLAARIIAVAGIYDLFIKGTFGKPANRTEALEGLRKEAGTRLDPQIVSMFAQKLEKEAAP